MDLKSLTFADLLKSLREEVRAEDSLIAHRMSWYAAAQAFLLAAFAAFYGKADSSLAVLLTLLPWVGITISAITWISIWSATLAQKIVLGEQKKIVNLIRSNRKITSPEGTVLKVYERLLYDQRPNKNGTKVGMVLHILGRLPPLLLPPIFIFTWTIALFL